MNILVTGGTGFLGKKLAQRLSNMGHHVTVIGRNTEIGNQLIAKGMTFVQVDLADKEAVVAACKGMDYVFHCGAYSSPWGRYEDFYRVNVRGTENVIAGCKTHQVKRLMHVSTPSLYFTYKQRLDVKENDLLPRAFINHYAKTKYLAETKIDQAFQAGLPVITIRPRAIFGPGDNAILPRLLEANEKKFVPLIRDGHAVMDLVYVENVVDALLLCMTSGEHTLGEQYNITNGERVQFKAVLDQTFEKIGAQCRYKKLPYALAFSLAAILEWVSRTFKQHKEPIFTRYTVTVLATSQTLNIDKAKRELGYKPRVSVKEGIDAFADWWKKQDDEINT